MKSESQPSLRQDSPQAISDHMSVFSNFSVAVSKSVKVIVCASVAAVLMAATTVRAEDPPKTTEDLEREALIEQFTQKMKDQNYPPMFEKAATEFGVPPKLLEGLAFAETRWEHMKWPPGETVSPENGMPRPYGIMSLWDNEFFGHSLIEAAKLIGKDPQVLKDDPYQNMRGAAALLKKIYDETPKPAYAKDGDMEAYTYAIAKYCGIPERDLNAQHAVDIYDWITEGYSQYGIEMTQVTNLNLGPMKEELAQIKAVARAKQEEEIRLHPERGDKDPLVENLDHNPEIARANISKPEIKGNATQPAVAATTAPVAAATTGTNQNSWLIWLVVLGGVALFLSFFVFRKKTPSPK
ncbi:MAG: hypothetical protein JWM68_416 [Verrucomicrobiales bacterium]|nr:hypothetical protein [Verrucomicrobiales bacterium]